MALSYVGGLTSTFVGAASGTQTISINGTLTGGSNTSPSTNDIVIVVYATGSTADRAIGVTTAGYTEEAELYSNGTSYDTNLSFSWKRMGTTVDTSVIVNATGNAADAGAVAIHVWRGVDTVTAMDVADTVATGTGTSRPNPAAITPVTTGAVIIVAGGGSAATGAVFTASYLSNFRTATSADTNDAMVGIGSVAWTSGAYDPAVWAGGSTLAANSWAAVTAALRPWVNQTLTANRYDNPDVFYAATITQSAPTQSLTASIYNNTNVFYAATITQGAATQNLTASRYNNSNTFYSASITKTYNAVASRYNNTNTFYNATVTVGAVTLTANRFNNSNTFYAAIVSTFSANQDVVVNRFNNTNVFYSPRIKETIYANRYNNSNTFYASTVTNANAINVGLYTNSNTFYSATVTAGFATQNITPLRFDNAAIFYNATVTIGFATQTLQPLRYKNTSVFYSPVVVREVYIPPLTPFYVEGVKVKKKVAEVEKEDIIDYDEELAILMLMAA